MVLVDFWLSTAGPIGLAGTVRGSAGSCADICVCCARAGKILDGGLAIDTPGVAESFDYLGENTEATLDSGHCTDLRLEERFSVL